MLTRSKHDVIIIGEFIKRTDCRLSLLLGDKVAVKERTGHSGRIDLMSPMCPYSLRKDALKI